MELSGLLSQEEELDPTILLIPSTSINKRALLCYLILVMNLEVTDVDKEVQGP